MELIAEDHTSEDDVTSALNGVIGTCPRSIATATVNVPTSSSQNLKAEWNDDSMKDCAPRSNEPAKTEPSLLLQLLSAPCSGCVNTPSSSLMSESSSAQSSPASGSLSRKSSLQSCSPLSHQESPPSSSPKPKGMKKRRRHKHIPIQYHYIISPAVETVQPPLKQEQALKAILEECQIAVECIPNYPTSCANTLDSCSYWESSPSDTQSSWRESDSGGLLDCISATTATSPFVEQNYNSHLYSFPNTDTCTEYATFSTGTRPRMMSCGQMEGEFPQLSQHSTCYSHCDQVPPSYSTAYGMCSSAGLQPTDYLYHGRDY